MKANYRVALCASFKTLNFASNELWDGGEMNGNFVRISTWRWLENGIITWHQWIHQQRQVHALWNDVLRLRRWRRRNLMILRCAGWSRYLNCIRMLGLSLLYLMLLWLGRNCWGDNGWGGRCGNCIWRSVLIICGYRRCWNHFGLQFRLDHCIGENRREID